MLFSSHFSLRRMVQLCRSMAWAYDAGIPLKRCFPLMGERSKSAKLRRVMGALSEGIASGMTLEQALRTQARHFPPLFVDALAAGEVGGSLSETFRYLADYYEERLSVRRKLQRQLAYPLALLFAIWFLLPIVVHFLRQAGGLREADFWTRYGHYVLRFGLRFAAVLVLLAILARLGIIRRVWDVLSFHVWPLAPMMRRLNLALFLRALAVLLQAGLDVPEAVRRSAALVPNRLMGKHLLRPLPRIESGASITEAFRAVPWLSPTVREMIAIAEESGALPETLARTAQALHAESMHPVYVIITLVEAIFILGIGMMVIGGMI